MVAVIAGALSVPIPLKAGDSPKTVANGYHVVGRHLYDRCGERAVLRGVNKMIIWTDIDGIPSCNEIAKTGANAVRIVWLTSGSATQLDEVISNCVAEQLVPLVELHDGIGDWSLLPVLVDYWTRPDILRVINKHHRYLLINVGNEVGDASVTPYEFRTGYESAVSRMRAAGIHVPLIIDGTDWGKDIDVLQSEGPALIEADPDHNLMFSIHMWWPRMWGYSGETVIDEVEESVNMELPLIVGEFGNQWTDSTIGEIPYLTILEQTHLLGIGMLPWEWGPGNDPQTWLDMTVDGTFETLQGWGLEVAVANQYSIHNTAVRPRSMVNGWCGSTPHPRVRRPGGRRMPNIPTGKGPS